MRCITLLVIHMHVSWLFAVYTCCQTQVVLTLHSWQLCSYSFITHLFLFFLDQLHFFFFSGILKKYIVIYCIIFSVEILLLLQIMFYCQVPVSASLSIVL